ncbi:MULTISPECIES: L,D-transpeptidase family protein [unclassified Photobacterium]|uniref:L,D-transpeptidase family protein n=1 Tax=unclassified Photobacterium TaxID=2628852 RepID=UPI000D17D19C|nr:MULTISPECIES: L,D-transpeptidase family protein [unclassified Photobacterium]PSV27934.1 amidase [Photobacterium sp. GB-56]PSV31924.1 amidase [Photobacterium sp. GB-72]PSV34170.1 amidase [Photobacterium sp. GB-210]PSV35361.1 amidase [Photobacterium sp. GB-27]PSV51038.1 amidase [Photobacterium sp. GB-1]
MKFSRKKINTFIGSVMAVSALLTCGSAFAANNVAQPDLDWHVLDGVKINSTASLCPQSTVKVCNDNILDALYADNNFMPFWLNPALVSAIMPQLQALADSDTLPGMKQRLQELKKLETRQDERGFDLLLTDTYLVYVDYVHQLMQDPRPLYNSQPVKLTPLSLTMAQKYFPLTVQKINSLIPSSQFVPTMGVINHLLSLPANPLDSSVVHFDKVISIGEPIPYGDKVATVLWNLGYLTQPEYQQVVAQATITNTGVINQAIKAFEGNYGLKMDGIIGPDVMSQLTRPYSSLVRLAALNLQRERFAQLEGDGPQIIVNIPDYKMTLYDNQKPVFESKIIDGMPKRPTNLFQSYINTVVINPYWYVPETIKVQNTIPSAKANPNFLTNSRMDVINSWSDRSVVPPSSIDWATVNPKTFTHEFRQDPGPENALGRVAFLMPDSFSVYMHDEAQSEYPLFNRRHRDLSSGCMRVQQPRKMATLILSYQNMPNLPSVDDMINTNNHREIGLDTHVNLDVAYLTAWVTPNGQLAIRPDIYGYDSPRAKPIQNQFISIPNYRTHQRMALALNGQSS